MAVCLAFPHLYLSGSYCGRPLREFQHGLGRIDGCEASGGMGAVSGLISGTSEFVFSRVSGADMASSLATIGFEKSTGSGSWVVSPLNTTSPTLTMASLSKYTSRLTVICW